VLLVEWVKATPPLAHLSWRIMDSSLAIRGGGRG
jgi:hypothetical protein